MTAPLPAVDSLSTKTLFWPGLPGSGCRSSCRPCRSGQCPALPGQGQNRCCGWDPLVLRHCQSDRYANKLAGLSPSPHPLPLANASKDA